MEAMTMDDLRPAAPLATIRLDTYQLTIRVYQNKEAGEAYFLLDCDIWGPNMSRTSAPLPRDDDGKLTGWEWSGLDLSLLDEMVNEYCRDREADRRDRAAIGRD